MKKFIALLFVLALTFFATKPALASIGVGVGTGKIQVDDILKPGQIYILPSLTVLNTGDQTATYKVSITYHENQPELMPAGELFTFSPATFELDPGEAQVVDVRLNLPLKIEPGDYFAYLEASPTETTSNGETSIGIAAAAKLYFTIAPANIFQAIYYKIISLWMLYSPWTTRVAVFVGICVTILILRKFLNIKISLRKKDE